MDMIKKHGMNETEIISKDFHLFYSYDTPVAAYDEEIGTIYVTEKKYSRTTTAHVKKWIKYLDEEYNWGDKIQLTESTFLHLSQEMNLGKTLRLLTDEPKKSREVWKKRYCNLLEDS